MHVRALVSISLVALVAGNALDDYCTTPDPNFAWTVTSTTYNLDGATGYGLNMTSQRWLTDKDSDRSIWWHMMVVIVPHKIKHHDSAMLYITGGENHGGWPSETSEDILLTATLAVSLGTVGVALFQIPNQPVYFAADPIHKRRVEDAVIAFTWQHFLDNPSEPEWLLRFPMTKACVQAMNATEQFMKQKFGADITRWIAAGASKRGWTTWTLGAVEAKSGTRLKAIIPIVMDALNLHKNMHHMFQNLGGWTFAFTDYYDLNLTARIDDPNFPAMESLIDGYQYLDRYVNMPKLVVDAGDDEFFQPDDNYFWWNEMTGEKHLLMCQDAEHSLITAIPEVVSGILAFGSAVLDNIPRPDFTWTVDLTNGTHGTIVAKEVSGTPTKVILYSAENLTNKRRDFRWIVKADDATNTCHWPFIAVPKKPGMCLQPILWKEEVIVKNPDGEYIVSKAIPETGRYTAFFLGFHYKSPALTEYRMTTQIAVLPATYPFPPCFGETCRGTLV
jgi:PhoPQ-activated pathogenicity-related protein